MKIAGKILNIVIWVLFAGLVIQRLSLWHKESQQKGAAIPMQKIEVLSADGSKAVQDLMNGEPRRILIFWATWCGPCKVELARAQNLIDDGKLRAQDILAVSAFEESDLLLQTARERKYTFPIGVDSEGALARQLDISGTPTTVFVEEGKVARISMGLSLLMEKSFKDFLSGNE